MDGREQPQKITYPKWGWALLIGAFVVMIALLGYQARYITVQLDRQNRQLQHSRDQADIARGDLRPALRELRPLVKELRPAAPELRPTLRAARPVLRDTGDLVRELQRFEAPRAIAAAGALARQLADGSQLERLVERTNRMLAELERRDTPRDVERTTDIAEELLRIQRESIATLKQSLDIQQRTLEHIRAIDQRTGGSREP